MAEKKTATKAKTVAKKKTTATKSSTLKKTVTKTVAKPAAKKASAKKTSSVAKPVAKVKSPAKKTASKPVAQKVSKSVKPVAKSKKVQTNAVKAKAPAQAKRATSKSNSPRKSSPQKTVTFKIQRSNGGSESRLDEFKVKYDDSTTILQALEDIKGYQDGTLTYRRSCRASICGSCGMFVNNRSRLACRTKVKDIVNGMEERSTPAEKVIELRPQNSQPVLKDLAVDIGAFYDKVDQIKPYVQEGKESEKDVDKTSFEQVNMVSNCIMCGCCYSDCTAMAENPDFLGPAALAKAFRFVSDPREGEKTKRLKELSEKNGIWDCTRCGMCVDACPKDVAPMEAIMKLRTRAMDAGITNNAGARHAMVFKDDIQSSGLLNEPMMILKTLGVSGAVGQLGNALNLAKKGKVPSFFPEKVGALDEVKAIYKELEENPISVETRQEDTGPGAG